MLPVPTGAFTCRTRPCRCIQTEHLSLQVGATCKHFAAYSLEQSDGFGRYFYDAKVTNRCAPCGAIRLLVLHCCSS